MVANYDSCAYKLALPEVTLQADCCDVKLTFIGKNQAAQTHIAVLSCELISLKKETFSIELRPDILRLDYNIRNSATGSFEKPATGFGLVGASIHLCVVDLENKQKAEIYFKRGADRKWALEGLELEENTELDCSLIREKRKKLRRFVLD